jgi:hypothetical protein
VTNNIAFLHYGRNYNRKKFFGTDPAEGERNSCFIFFPTEKVDECEIGKD